VTRNLNQCGLKPCGMVIPRPSTATWHNTADVEVRIRGLPSAAMRGTSPPQVGMTSEARPCDFLPILPSPNTPGRVWRL